MAAERSLAAFALKGIVDFRIDPEQRARFKCCRRQWNFASPHRRGREPVAQHEGSGGGRSIPRHQRESVRASRVETNGRFDQHTAGPLRRTHIRRTGSEVAAVGTQLATEALDMLRDAATYPNPGTHCSVCEFAAPCLAMFAGADPEPVLAAQFRPRSLTDAKPRLGQATWGFGRGAAPRRWDQ